MLKKGDFISIDGTSGEVFAGEVKTAPSEVVQVLVGKTLDGKDSARVPAVRRADEDGGPVPQARHPHQRRHARPGGQRRGVRREGRRSGDRTEHMFFEGDRIDAMREMILAEDEESRRAALAKLLPLPEGGLRGHFPRS